MVPTAHVADPKHPMCGTHHFFLFFTRQDTKNPPAIERNTPMEDHPLPGISTMPLGEAAATLTYMLLGDPSNPIMDAEELEEVCNEGPKMTDEEYKMYMQDVRAMLVQEWVSWGYTSEDVDAMLAAEERKTCS